MSQDSLERAAKGLDVGDAKTSGVWTVARISVERAIAVNNRRGNILRLRLDRLVPMSIWLPEELYSEFSEMAREIREEYGLSRARFGMSSIARELVAQAVEQWACRGEGPAK